MAARPFPYDEPQPGSLVERFSWEMEARQRTENDTEEYDQLRLDLIAERNRRESERRTEIQRIESHFQATRSEDEIILEKAKKRLLQSMKQFSNLVPGHLKKDDPPTSWDEVWSVATEVQKQWEARSKDNRVIRAKNWFRRMCNGLNNHSAALKMLPSESEYVSLVAGSVSMIIKASANYINISESFAQGISEINDAVGMEYLSHVYDTPSLQQITMRLYAHIFSYLIRFMTWYTDRSRTRFLKSFNENSQVLFEDDLAQVKRISGLLSRQIQLHMSADVKISKLMLDELHGDMKYLLRSTEFQERQTRIRDAANAELLQATIRCQLEKTRTEMKGDLKRLMEGYQEQIRSSISGCAITNLLEQQVLQDIQEAAPRKSGDHSRENAQTYSDGESDDMTMVVTIKDIGLASRHFEDYFSWDQVQPFEGQRHVLGEAMFVTRLEAFTTRMASQVLYAHSQYHPEGTSLLRRSAVAYMSMARRASIPVVSYFCRLSADDPPEHRSRESVELSAMLYAMIRQLVSLLPPGNQLPEAEALADDVAALDGTLRTWKQAIRVFERLAGLVRLPVLLFVMDGLNVVEDPAELSTGQALEDVVRCLVHLAKEAKTEQDSIIKVLFTTSGLSGTLCHLLDRANIVSCNESTPGSSRRRVSHNIRQMMFYPTEEDE